MAELGDLEAHKGHFGGIFSIMIEVGKN